MMHVPIITMHAHINICHRSINHARCARAWQALYNYHTRLHSLPKILRRITLLHNLEDACYAHAQISVGRTRLHEARELLRTRMRTPEPCWFLDHGSLAQSRD